jgi:hypothetical protein
LIALPAGFVRRATILRKPPPWLPNPRRRGHPAVRPPIQGRPDPPWRSGIRRSPRRYQPPRATRSRHALQPEPHRRPRPRLCVGVIDAAAGCFAHGGHHFGPIAIRQDGRETAQRPLDWPNKLAVPRTCGWAASRSDHLPKLREPALTVVCAVFPSVQR